MEMEKGEVTLEEQKLSESTDDNKTEKSLSESSFLLKSVFENRPSVIFFQYESSMLQKKTERSYEINWNDKSNKNFSIYYKSYKNEPN